MIKAIDAKLMNEIIKNSFYKEKKEELLELFNNENYRRYFFSKMPRNFEDLSIIDYLLDIMAKEKPAYDFVDILHKSINGRNASLILEKIKKYYFDLSTEELYQVQQRLALRIVKDIVDKFPAYFDEALLIVQTIIDAHSKEYNNWESKNNYEEEREEVGEILNLAFKYYVENKNDNKIDEIVAYIKKKFSLIHDDSNYVFYTPSSIFDILKQFIQSDSDKFEERFNEVKSFITKKYAAYWIKPETKKIVYRGWELSGGGLSFGGSNYQISDKFYVQYIFGPILSELYKNNSEVGWNYIKNNCITSEKRVSIERPDFLNRAVLQIILERYLQGNNEQSKEAQDILEEFVGHSKGIPNKAEIIFNTLRASEYIEKAKPLIYKYIEKYPTPTTPIIYQLVARLAANGDELIVNKLENWIIDEKFIRGFLFSHEVAELITKIAEKNFDFGIKLFEKFIFSEQFTEEFDRFDVFDLANFYQSIRVDHFSEWLRIQNKIFKLPKLHESKNLQILLGFGLLDKQNSEKDNEQVLMKVYTEFVQPNILSKKFVQIYEIISHHAAREAFVQFAEKLTSKKKIKEALEIVKFFIEDPDPFLPGNDPEDQKIEFNEHKGIENGDENPSITSVRGWCAWVLMQCAILEGRGDINEILALTKKLLNDKNYYVKYMACYPLSRLAQNRLARMPEGENSLYLDINNNKKEALELAKLIEQTAFDFLDDIVRLDNEKAQNVLAKAILSVFNHIRSLNNTDALKLLNNFKDNLSNKAIAEAAPLFIYFAIFRKDNFKDWPWVEKGLYDDLDKFDPKKFNEILFEIISRNSEEINQKLSWQFFVLPKEQGGENFNALFDVSLKYLTEILKYHNQKVFENIYHFLEKYFESKPDECTVLLKDLMIAESTFLDKTLKEKKNLYSEWWPNYYHGDLLLKIKQKKGNKEFLKFLKLEMKYPKNLYLRESVKAVKGLVDFPKDDAEVKEIFDYFIECDELTFMPIKQEWEGQK